MTKSDTEIMEILEAYDLTGTVWSAAALTGHDPKTVKRYVEARRPLVDRVLDPGQLGVEGRIRGLLPGLRALKGDPAAGE
ncbi:hypothetical protein ACFWSJ_32820 [Streptomyces niveus]|uniref:hypothetical protein n=1 Tax=Streptomyces niveus TaxID=193462 RepID=UPI003669FD75